MVDLVQSLNEAVSKAKRLGEGQGNEIRWRSEEERYIKMVRTLDVEIRQKEKDRAKEKEDEGDEMASLIEPEYTGGEVKLRGKGQAESFEEFMKRRSKKVEEVLKSMEVIGRLYNDLNEMALEQDK